MFALLCTCFTLHSTVKRTQSDRRRRSHHGLFFVPLIFMCCESCGFSFLFFSFWCCSWACCYFLFTKALSRSPFLCTWIFNEKQQMKWARNQNVKERARVKEGERTREGKVSEQIKVVGAFTPIAIASAWIVRVAQEMPTNGTLSS